MIWPVVWSGIDSAGWVVLTLSVSLPAIVAIALVLVLSDPPRTREQGGGLAFDRILTRDRVAMPDPVGVAMRDGYRLQVRDFGPCEGPLIVLVHGSGWTGLQFDRLAEGLRSLGHVVAVDLRGHGAVPGRRGDIDRIGQLEDDLADLAAHYGAGDRNRRRKLVLVGHSSGGGLVVRFAGGTYGARMDAAVLLAPFLKHDAPTTRANSGGWARVQVRRLIGLTLLNGARITALNHLPVISFAFPETVLNGPLGALATPAYSYRLNLSYAPRRDYLADVAALPRFVLIAGSEDEAFRAREYAPLMSQVTDKGRYVLVPGVGHLDIVDAPETLATIQETLRAL